MHIPLLVGGLGTAHPVPRPFRGHQPVPRPPAEYLMNPGTELPPKKMELVLIRRLRTKSRYRDSGMNVASHPMELAPTLHKRSLLTKLHRKLVVGQSRPGSPWNGFIIPTYWYCRMCVVGIPLLCNLILGHNSYRVQILLIVVGG